MNYWIFTVKWYNRWLRLLIMLLPGQIYIALGPWHFGDFCKIFLPNIGKTKQKSNDFRVGPLAGTAPYYGKSRIQPWLMHYAHKNAIWRSVIATFRRKTLHFFRVIRLNWLAKIEMSGARGPWSSILLLVTVASKKCKKKTETKEAVGFFGTFLSLVKFQLGEVGSLVLPSLATPMLQLRKAKKVFANFPWGFWRFPTKFRRFKK